LPEWLRTSPKKVLGACWSRLFWDKILRNKEERNKRGRNSRNGPKKQRASGIKENRCEEKKNQSKKWLD
jgi:hypothetical protein